MTRYVAGFCFDPEPRSVLLVRKNKPAWQAGRLNGIGGKVEDDDASALAAMVREWSEEVGPGWSVDWREVATLHSGGHEIVFFAGSGPSWYDLHRAGQQENDIGERLEHWSLSALRASVDTLPNLSWLLPLAAYRHDTYEPLTIKETSRS